MSAMSNPDLPGAPDRAAQPLRPTLHILRLQGQALNLVWPWPETSAQINLTQVFEAMALEVDETTGQELERCILQNTTGPQGGLSFSHHCLSLRCSHNGQTVPAGQRLWLQDDDRLEIGLCRLGISTPPLARPEPTADVPSPEPGGIASPALAHEGMALEELEALGNTALQSIGELLGVPALEAQQAESAAEADNSDPLARWHRHYLHQLRFPHQPPDHTAWSLDAASTTQPSGPAQAMLDPLEQLIHAQMPELGLAEMLGQSQDIDTVLVTLGTQGEQDILSPPEPENVLHLFAPEHWQSPDERLDLPLLSRMEHHGIAIDSAIRVSDMRGAPAVADSSTDSPDPTEQP